MLTEKELCYHTSKVYELILFMLLSYSAGIYASINVFGHSTLTYLFFVLGSFYFLFMYFLSKSANGKFYNSMAMGCCLGITGGYLVEYANLLNSTFVPASLGMTVAVFSAFTIVSRNVDNNKALAIGSICGALLNILVFNGILSLFIPMPNFITLFQVLVGLVTFCCFVIYDTENMHKKFLMGNINYYEHAISLFLDFINIFVNLLVYLVKYKELELENKNKKKRKY